MEDKPQKPPSIFASISPAPAPAAPPPASRPAVSEDTVNLLRQKIDALEKNIISQLDKRLSEQAKAAAAQPAPANATPPPPPPRQQAVEAAFLQKMGELERRMEEFGRMTMLSASQMKNIEESKISARREIEDLLKAVREQQKYSELDRQMHDQLEKSWARVEELEKKLMGFYASLLDSRRVGQEEESRLSAGLACRLSAMETRLAGQEQVLAGLVPALDKTLAERLGALESRRPSGADAVEELKRAVAEEFARQAVRGDEFLRAQAQAQRAVFEEFFRERLNGLSDALSSGLAAIGRESADLRSGIRNTMEGELASLREEFARQARELGSQIDSFRGTAEANRLRAEGVENSLAGSAREISSSLERALKASEESSRTLAGEFVSRLEASHKRQLEELNARYADAFRGYAVLERARLLSASALCRLEEIEAGLSAVLGSVDEARLPLVPGVSGIVLRRALDGLRGALAGLRADAAPLRALREYAAGRIAEGLPEKPGAG